jgi:isocitrate dehydrogenase
MKRVSIFIREDQIEGLSDLSKSRDIPSAELIREAIDYKLLTEFGRDTKEQILEKTHGMLKDRFKKEIKSEEIETEIREEWKTRSERNK